MFVLGLSVAKVAKFMFRDNNIFMLVFDLSVAEGAEVAGFSEVRGVERFLKTWVTLYRY